jgi:hypothetical protein
VCGIVLEMTIRKRLSPKPPPAKPAAPHRPLAVEMTAPDKDWKLELLLCRCSRCGYEWVTTKAPLTCANQHCRSAYWQRGTMSRPDLSKLQQERWAKERDK